MATQQTWLDSLLNKIIQAAGVAQPTRSSLNFVSGATVTDNPGNDSTDVTISAGTGAGGQNDVILVNGANNNIPLNGKAVTRITGPSAAFSITGLSWGSSIPDGQPAILVNTTSQALTLANESASSLAANRIQTLRAVDFPTVPAGGIVRVTWDKTAGRWVLEHIGAMRPKGAAVRDFGAKGNGTTDDSAAINNAITYLVSVGGGELFFHGGIYAIASQVKYRTANATAIRWVGEVGNGVGAAGEATIRWTGGTFADAAVRFEGTSNVTVSDLIFDANQTALHAVWVQEGSPSLSTESMKFNNCAFVNPNGSGSASFAVGTALEFDVADFSFVQCSFDCANTPTSESGIRFYGSGNNKEFAFLHCIFRGYSRAAFKADLAIEGTCTLTQCIFASSAAVVDLDIELSAGGAFICTGCESEGANHFLYAPGTTGFGAGAIILDGCFWAGAATDNSTSYGGAYAHLTQDVAAYVVGSQLINRGSTFVNGRAAGSSEAKFVVSAMTPGSVQPCQIRSESCSYMNSYTAPPFYDTAGNHLITSDTARTTPYLGVASAGDMGGNQNGSGLVLFPDYTGNTFQVGGQQMVYGSNTTGVTVNDPGHVNGATAKFTVGPTAWSHANVFGGILLAAPLAKSRIKAVIADTTTAYAGTGLTGTIQLSVGSGNGVAGQVTDDYLLRHDVKTAAVRRGEDILDVGSALSPDLSPTGRANSWSGTGQIIPRLLASAGSIGSLTQGQTSFYVTYEVLR